MDLFFAASKVFWALAAPGNALVALGVAGLLLGLARPLRRVGRVLVAVCILGFLAIGLLPVDRLLLGPLETRFQRPAEPPAAVRGIVVLGGAVDPVLARATGDMGLLDAAERLLAGAELARLHPDAVLLHAGGSGLLLRQDVTEAEAAARVFAAAGLPEGRVVYESASRNTWENAVLGREAVRPLPGETWILVTSAFHMPRSVGVFRAVGWDVVPWPVDHRVALGEPSAPALDVARRLSALHLAVHEYVGLAAYRLSGRTADLFPGP